MRRQDHENDTVCPEPPMLETAGDESPSWPSSPFFPVPDELIYHILLRLPVKSLLRFRCVSKSWKTLISDPKFAEDHLRTSTADPNMTNQRLVYSTTQNEFKTISCSLQSLVQFPPTPPETLISQIDTKFEFLGFEILGSCNGLLCLFYTSFPQNYVRLCNPSTRCGSQGFPIANSVGIYSDITYHGFGYDHVSDMYKLLVVFKIGGNVVTNIFTFGANSWTTIQNFPVNCGKCRRWLGKFVCGTLNWIVKRHDDHWVIVSLDLGKENFGELLLPELEDDRIFQHVLGVLRGSLCFGYLNSKNQWVVWLMKEYGVQESWTKLRVISRWPYFIDSACIFENGVMMKTKYSKRLLFNSNDGRLVNPVTSSKVRLDLHIYQESFVSPLC